MQRFDVLDSEYGCSDSFHATIDNPLLLYIKKCRAVYKIDFEIRYVNLDTGQRSIESNKENNSIFIFDYNVLYKIYI